MKVLAACLFFGILIFSEIGRRIGIARLAHDPEGLAKGVGAAEAAVFGLMGLIVAFTFSGAAARFEERRHLITAEANAIGTAYLRIELLPDATQPELKRLFRRYIEVRSVTYQDLNLGNLNTTVAKLAEGAALQTEIWTKALAACRRQEAPSQAVMLLLPALNEMIDITTTRVMATRNHPPLVVFLLLGGLILAGALLVGYDTSPNEWVFRRKRPVELPRKRPLFRCESGHHSGEKDQCQERVSGLMFLYCHSFGFLVKH